jgi:uncharacterized protein YjbJ (UPF0337 family)
MKQRTKDIAKGTLREAKGKVEKAAGRVTGNTRLKIKGRIDSGLGKAQRKLGEADRELEKEEKE